jgi:hypothetical protein
MTQLLSSVREKQHDSLIAKLKRGAAISGGDVVK